MTGVRLGRAFPWRLEIAALLREVGLRWLVRGKVAGMQCALRPERDAYKIICVGLESCAPKTQMATLVGSFGLPNFGRWFMPRERRLKRLSLGLCCRSPLLPGMSGSAGSNRSCAGPIVRCRWATFGGKPACPLSGGPINRPAGCLGSVDRELRALLAAIRARSAIDAPSVIMD